MQNNTYPVSVYQRLLHAFILTIHFHCHLKNTMREIDQTRNNLICAGEDLSIHWPLKTRESIKLLEKKEIYCSWFQKEGGDVETQFPALRSGDTYYSMPLKVQKM